jgi:tetratricopeptide (TPR) repeat protein
MMGERENGTVRLEEAVKAERDALEELTREQMPLVWAQAQYQLGRALAMLGERENGTARLEQAVAAHRAALEEYTRDRVPLDWARTQNALGDVLRALGERDGGTTQLEQAVDAFDAALSVYASPGLERYRQTCQTNWDRAVALLNQRLGPNRDLDAAK